MKIVKVINNNFVSAVDEQGKEMVVMGKGIGFRNRAGDPVPQKGIEKLFYIEDSELTKKFKDLLKNLPVEHMRLAVEIIEYAKDICGKSLNEGIYVTLTDHISFAIKQYQKNQFYSNPLFWEIKQFYKSEYLIGDYAVKLIAQRTGIQFKEDEAASIALHIVNAEYNTGISETMRITTMIHEILDVVKESFLMEIDEESIHYSRFVSHIKFLCKRILKGELLSSMDQEFISMIQEKYPEEYACSCKIGEFVKEKYNYTVTTEELMYLAIHVRRMRDTLGED